LVSSQKASNIHIEDLNFTPFIERIRSKLARLASLDDLPKMQAGHVILGGPLLTTARYFMIA
jgi:hypothetical protein